MTEQKTMYALTWCYEGVDDNTPSAQTIAVSEDKNKLIDEMETWIIFDCEEIRREDFESEEEYENATWEDDVNFQVVRKSSTEVLLQHRKRTDLYTTYRIHSTKVL